MRPAYHSSVRPTPFTGAGSEAPTEEVADEAVVARAAGNADRPPRLPVDLDGVPADEVEDSVEELHHSVVCARPDVDRPERNAVLKRAE